MNHSYRFPLSKVEMIIDCNPVANNLLTKGVFLEVTMPYRKTRDIDADIEFLITKEERNMLIGRMYFYPYDTKISIQSFDGTLEITGEIASKFKHTIIGNDSVDGIPVLYTLFGTISITQDILFPITEISYHHIYSLYPEGEDKVVPIRL